MIYVVFLYDNHLLPFPVVPTIFGSVCYSSQSLAVLSRRGSAKKSFCGRLLLIFGLVFYCHIVDKPDQPRDLHSTTITEDSVTLNWLAPKDDGGSPITQYIVEKRETLRMSWQPAGTFPATSTSGKVSGLEEGVQYVFRVSAVNSVGSGPAAELNRAVAAKSPHCE